MCFCASCLGSCVLDEVRCLVGLCEGPHKTLKETPARADLDRPTDPQRPYDAKPTIRQNLIFCEK